jgi:signal peptidase I
MPTQPPPPEPSSVKETVISVIIAFALAFVFRGFVIEAFLIPTGSMAPTLRGAHMQFKSPQSGYEWAVTPWQYADQAHQVPNPVQTRITVHDPMTEWEIHQSEVARSWGDRIFVMKYLYSIYDPERFDVVVFKNPRDPTVNYIKRLIGLPGQMVALVDGDVFWRDVQPGEVDDRGNSLVPDPWALPGWHAAHKPERAQRAMWQPVFSSEYTPLTATASNRRWFTSPWVAPPASHDWQIQDRRDYVYSGSGPTSLEWDTTHHPIDDRYSYNEGMLPYIGPYPVSDIRLSLGFRPQVEGERVSAIVTARGHEFRGDIDGSTVTLRMRPVDTSGQGTKDWTVLATANLSGPLPAGRVTNIDFWHVDQALSMFIDDTLVASKEYTWGIQERLFNSTGMNLEQVMAQPLSLIESHGAALPAAAPGGRPVYSRPQARFEFSGGGFTAYRVALARDIYYQPAQYSDANDAGLAHSKARQPALGTHPTNTVILNKDQFFVCGDNSPQSLDARLWDLPNPWVAEIDPKMGVVNRDLVIGKAFFVYFPAPKRRGSVPVPDFGSMRFIW